MSIRLRSYSRLLPAVKRTAARLVVLFAALVPPAAQDDPPPRFAAPADLTCPRQLAALFTPPRPQLGRYDVCTTRAGIESVAEGWTIEPLDPIDALGAAGRYDRGAAARLYGGRRANVARGWMADGRALVSMTLISPYPDLSLMTLNEGTLVIRYFVPSKP